MTTKKRVGIQLNESVYDKLQNVADSYGMSVNGLMAYILGQWVDTNYGLKDRISEKLMAEMVKTIQNPESNPLADKMIKEMTLIMMEMFKDMELEKMKDNE